MMEFIALLVLLAGFAWLAVWADRRIQLQKHARLAATATPTESETKPNQGWLAGWRRPQPKNNVQAFRTWATAAFADQPVLQHWLASLSDEVIQLLTVKLTDFCTDLGFEFVWLLDGKVDKETTFAPRLQIIAVQYIEACYQAYLAQDDVKTFQAWQGFTQHPYGKEQLALAQRVLAQLLDLDLTPAAARSLLTAPAKERDVYVVQAVLEAAEKHPDTFRTVLKAVLTTNNVEAPAPERRNHRPAPEGQPATTAA
ncbi:MAG: hypothetical protein NT075_04020 [Chloroflexi bacterium]|nr:hypothetical protein [Chloroflexota bacterium]